MESFVRHQNVERYLQLLATTTDASERQRATKLLAKERQKQKDAGDTGNAAIQRPADAHVAISTEVIKSER